MIENMEIAPTYCNQVEINTLHTKEDGDMVELRFFFQHPPISKDQAELSPFPAFPVTFGPVVIMPRGIAKHMLKKFLTFMAVQDEGRNLKRIKKTEDENSGF